LCRECRYRKFVKSPLIYSVSYFNLGTLGLCLEGETHQSTPMATGLNPPELPISDEVRNDAHIATTGVKLHWRTPRVATSKNETGN